MPTAVVMEARVWCLSGPSALSFVGARLQRSRRCVGPVQGEACEGKWQTVRGDVTCGAGRLLMGKCPVGSWDLLGSLFRAPRRRPAVPLYLDRSYLDLSPPRAP